jgi:hypothetical protein
MQNVLNFNIEYYLLYVKSRKNLNSYSNLNFTLTTNLVASFLTLLNFLWDVLVSKHHAWKNVWNSLNFLSHPPCMISWYIDKFHDILT